jgi:4-diphosphocytidyl-2-C-methyl-D-erythritol kinase
LLQQKTNTTLGAALRLVKNIPVGAGLGGGSADAAATLRALNDFWHVQVPVATLQDWAKELGADVAMCVASAPAIARGVGDVLTPIGPLPPIHLVLAHPRVPLLTADVFAAYAGSSQAIANAGASHGGGASHGAGAAIQTHELEAVSLPQLLELLKTTRNDLQQPAIQVSPVVAQVLLALETLMPAPSLVRMTGSGACCFAIYDSAEAATRACTQLQTEHPFWWVRQAVIGDWGLGIRD